MVVADRGNWIIRKLEARHTVRVWISHDEMKRSTTFTIYVSKTCSPGTCTGQLLIEVCSFIGYLSSSRVCCDSGHRHSSGDTLVNIWVLRPCRDASQKRDRAAILPTKATPDKLCSSSPCILGSGVSACAWGLMGSIGEGSWQPFPDFGRIAISRFNVETTLLDTAMKWSRALPVPDAEAISPLPLSLRFLHRLTLTTSGLALCSNGSLHTRRTRQAQFAALFERVQAAVCPGLWTWVTM
eukprot:TRINITY_DN46335_c0_g1_i2.p1 TRINITY_DN46335_c0_g1~~TRINITY_DN46335_c0_g1_i2.p1  ORF type:complete len:240 (-),score=11.03 TRINITY_DN46335_c0_g1_i2:117-836(-)